MGAPTPPHRNSMVRPTYTGSYQFPGCRVRLAANARHPIEAMARVFRHFVVADADADEPTFEIVLDSDRYRIVRNDDRSSFEVSAPSLVPCLEAEITQFLVRTLSNRVLLHAACVTRGGRAVVMPGESGRGKTTLSATLVRRGCGYLSEELTLVDLSSRTITPFPKAFSLKPPSFGLLEGLVPDPAGAGSEPIWHLDPEDLRPGSVATEAAPVDWVVFPFFEAGTDLRLEALTPGETTLGLFENMVNVARHKAAGLDVLIAIAMNAAGYRLRFADPGRACDAIDTPTAHERPT